MAKKSVVFRKFKARKVKMWYSEYKNNCEGCLYRREMAVPSGEVFAYAPLERRPVIVLCGLVDEKCSKVTPWENE